MVLYLQHRQHRSSQQGREIPLKHLNLVGSNVLVQNRRDLVVLHLQGNDDQGGIKYRPLLRSLVDKSFQQVQCNLIFLMSHHYYKNPLDRQCRMESWILQHKNFRQVLHMAVGLPSRQRSNDQQNILYLEKMANPSDNSCQLLLRIPAGA